MSKKIFLNFILLLIFIGIIAPVVLIDVSVSDNTVIAQVKSTVPKTGGTTGATNFKITPVSMSPAGVTKILVGLADWLYVIAALFVIIMGIRAAFYYLKEGSADIKKAHTAFRNVVIGAIALALVFGLDTLINAFLNAKFK